MAKSEKCWGTENAQVCDMSKINTALTKFLVRRKIASIYLGE